MPAPRPTAVQITIPVITHPHGIINPVFKKMAKIFPTPTPNKIPKKAPSKLIITL
jgi:hypothetical protein